MSGSREWRPACSQRALQARAELLAEVRAFFAQRHVLEVQTACIGARAVTDPDIESLPVPGLGYLQTSPEYQMKRLLAAGAPAIYSMGPVFRGGESGRLHNPEFTMLEWYRPGFTDVELMAEVQTLVDAVLGPTEYDTLSYAEVVARAGAGPPGGREDLDLAFAEGLISLQDRRVFVVDYPADQAALARLRKSDERLAARFELCVNGLELANGYFEEGDATVLRRRFEADLARRAARGQPLPEIDEAFLTAMAAGLPDCAGVALGIDRLLMLRMGAASLADVMPFPADRA